MNNEALFRLQVNDLKSGNLDPEIITTESDELTLVNNFFSSITCNNKELENLLFEIIGYCVTRSTKLRKAFILRGTGANGKSKILRIIEKLLADGKCSHLHLEDICGSKAGAKTKVDKLANCCACLLEDQKPVKYVNSSLITRIISGEPIAVGDSEIRPYCKMIFTVNEVIDLHETGFQIRDRFLVLPFNGIFTSENNNRDINIEEKLCQKEPLRIIATKAIEAYKKVLENGHFTVPQIVIDETNKYFLECNNVAEFCKLYPVATFIIKSDYYDQYKQWCLFNNREAVSNTVFGKEVLALGYRSERYSFHNDRKTYYTNPNFDNSESQSVYANYIKATTISSEEASNYTDDELEKKYNQMPTFDEYLCQEIHLNLPEDEQELQDDLSGSQEAL